MELETSERGESQIDNFIERRDQERRLTEGERAEHDLWQESVERYNTKRQAELVFAWVSYHEAAAERALANGQAIADRHRAQIEALLGPGHNGNGHREERNGHHGD